MTTNYEQEIFIHPCLNYDTNISLVGAIETNEFKMELFHKAIGQFEFEDGFIEGIIAGEIQIGLESSKFIKRKMRELNISLSSLRIYCHDYFALCNGILEFQKWAEQWSRERALIHHIFYLPGPAHIRRAYRHQTVKLGRSAIKTKNKILEAWSKIYPVLIRIVERNS